MSEGQYVAVNSTEDMEWERIGLGEVVCDPILHAPPGGPWDRNRVALY